MTLRILTLDLGKNIAWSVRINGQVQTGWKFMKGTRQSRAAATYVYLRDLFALYADDIDLIVYERPFARGFDATRSLWGLAGLVEALGTAAGLPVLDVTPSEIKIWAAGKGNAEKKDMMDAAARLGYDRTGKEEEAVEHESDAFCLMCFMEATARETTPKPLVERKTVKKRDQTRKDLPR